MKLLAVGRSIGRFGNDHSPFKMTQQSLLPKFGSAKVPGEPARDSGEKRNQAIAPAALPVEQSQFANAATGDKTMNAVRAEQSEPLTEVAAPAAVKPVSDRPAFPRGRWTLFKNPFSKAGKTKTTTAPVQTEMRLDLVKPVRNDLSDSDLEVVRVQSRPAVEVAERLAAAPAVSVMPVAPSAPVAAAESNEPVMWDRIKNQFLGAGKS